MFGVNFDVAPGIWKNFKPFKVSLAQQLAYAYPDFFKPKKKPEPVVDPTGPEPPSAPDTSTDTSGTATTESAQPSSGMASNMYSVPTSQQKQAYLVSPVAATNPTWSPNVRAPRQILARKLSQRKTPYTWY